ncbi:hypothetical protein IID62_07430 [candidate division KSB1 bacterium]|nr:hypothetical protein [candidate division KSB1 bacterium]
MESFCNYTPVARNLPKGEFVTLVLRNAAYDGDRKRDRILVINKKQWTSCRDGSWDGEVIKQGGQLSLLNWSLFLGSSLPYNVL